LRRYTGEKKKIYRCYKYTYKTANNDCESIQVGNTQIKKGKKV
jgi:hypothetical protein